MKRLILIFGLLAAPAFGQYTIGQWTAATAGTGGSTAATPTFSPVAGTYTSTQTVTISTTTPLAVLCYTTDGSTPTEVSNLCSGGTTATYSTPINVSATHTVKALGTLATYTDSSVASALYTITTGPPTLTYDWLAYNTVCASTPCFHDIVAGDDATNATSGNRPTYSATSGPNSTPGLTGNGATKYLTLGTVTSGAVTQYSGFVVENSASLSSQQTLFGSGATGLTINLAATNGHLLFGNGGSTVATCTTSYSASTWYAIAFTFNTSTKAYACYTISGVNNTYAAAGSGTASAGTYTTGIVNLVANSAGGAEFHSTIPEMGLATGTIWGSTQLTQLTAYIHATYPGIP